MRRLFQLVAGGWTACGLAMCSAYHGPTLRFSAGYNGVELGVTLFSAPPSPAEKATQTLSTLATGKNPILP